MLFCQSEDGIGTGHFFFGKFFYENTVAAKFLVNVTIQGFSAFRGFQSKHFLFVERGIRVFFTLLLLPSELPVPSSCGSSVKE